MCVIFSSSGSLRMRLISQFSRASGARFSETDDSPETVVGRWILPAKLKALLGSSTILSQVVAGKDLMVESKSPLFGIAPSVCKRLLFSVVFLVCHHLFRGTKLVFHLLAVANLSAPLEKDPVVHIESLVDHEDVVQLVLDGDLALMHHVIFADDVNVSLVEDLERRPLGDNECVLERSADQHAAGLAMTEQAVRVRKIRAKGYVPGLVVELGLDRTDFAGLRELVAVRQLEFDFLILVTLLQAGHVFEVLGLGYVEVNPHHAVIGQGREEVPLLDQAAELLVLAVDDAVERCSDFGKVQFGLRQVRRGPGPVKFGLEQEHLILRDDCF